jgi:acetolactate synthase-1/3 small subunit
MTNENTQPRIHTISVLVENKPGVLARVTGLFARRGFNIESLAVSITEDPTISRITVVATGGDKDLEQITKQMNKLIDVIKVIDHTGEELVEREIALIKVKATTETRGEIMQVTSVFRANIVDISTSEETVIIEVTGRENKIDAFLECMKKFNILEMCRTGKIALVRGAKMT